MSPQLQGRSLTMDHREVPWLRRFEGLGSLVQLILSGASETSNRNTDQASVYTGLGLRSRGETG